MRRLDLGLFRIDHQARPHDTPSWAVSIVKVAAIVPVFGPVGITLALIEVALLQHRTVVHAFEWVGGQLSQVFVVTAAAIG